MMKGFKTSPCDGCKDRYVTDDGDRCHSTCKKYAEWWNERELWKIKTKEIYHYNQGKYMAKVRDAR